MSNDREALIQRGLQLNYLTLAYNVLEALLSLAAGVRSGSIALMGFGFDSVIEVAASGAAQWRLRADADRASRARVERLTARIIACSFLLLGIYVLTDSIASLWRREQPRPSTLGVVVLGVSVVVMPALARAKRHVAHRVESVALSGEAAQTSLCAYLSAIALAGVVLNAWFGWWWADPAAALAMVPIMVREAADGLRGRHCSDGC
ncbi:MAG TPA: cation transporter [Gemmatimonadaceae bacterium]